MHSDKGLKNELLMIDAIHDKTYSRLPNNLKHLVDEMFTDLDRKTKFKAEKLDPMGKPDIGITFKDQHHYVSVKCGSNTTVHAEMIKRFILFLRSYGISNRTQSTILLYQYGDGTKDGTGKVRLNYEQLLPQLADRIHEANLELNANRKLVLDFVDLCLFRGNFENTYPADYIYHGTPEYGVLCSKAQIMKHVSRRSFDYMRNLHIGPIQFGPRARYIHGDGMHPDQRHWVAFRWVRLPQDLAYISERYNG